MKEVKQDKGSFMAGFAKVIGVIVKFFAKEFLWVFGILLIGIPLAFVFVYVIDAYSEDSIKTELYGLTDKIPLILIAYIYSVLGVYFTRMVVSAINTMIKG
ncbi:hypothetical protein [Xanthomarina gelatinilytica]|uniref:hypothetical protein n=1 Tax=Xanthomarina gelatinilytica TaxID=1137281 RepID=UPI003AA95EF6